MSCPSKSETLAALARVSRGAVWHAQSQRDPWKSIGDLAAELVWKSKEAAE